jgi:hypothetical protein
MADLNLTHMRKPVKETVFNLQYLLEDIYGYRSYFDRERHKKNRRDRSAAIPA